jgi:hypothetical protein
MLAILRRIRNILFCKLHSFRIESFSKKNAIIRPGENVQITGSIKNNGLRIGTVYLIIKLADPYDHGNVICNTNYDFDEGRKQALRFVDIKPGKVVEFCCDIKLPKNIKRGVLDIRLELWTPDKLFTEALSKFNSYNFDKTKWSGMVEVVDSGSSSYRVFVSYSWFSEIHRDWVRQLSEELLRHGISAVLDQKDIYPGDDIIEFMDAGVSSHPLCIAVCSAEYTSKANRQEGYVWHEVELLTRLDSLETKSIVIIPIVRDNPAKTIPDRFGKIVYIDMDIDEWRAKPLSILVDTINRNMETK